MKYFLFLDYDGTLTPIVKKPGLATLSRSRRAFLKKLRKASYIVTAIISGRMLSDLKQRVGIGGLYYVGNHGFEIEGPGIRITHPKALQAKPILREIKTKLKKSFQKIKGVIIEDKILTLSLHYRLVQAKDFRIIKRVFPGIVRPYLKTKKIRLTHGKKVFEIRPNINWNKGRAVLWFLKKLKAKKKDLPIYIGDDTTDEDAFRLLKKRGLTIRVGRAKRTCAKYYLKDVDGVYKFLKFLALEF
ncbi:MAG: trehalose-phosphatase [Candidatus Margulisiibacteriota bacterium]